MKGEIKRRLVQIALASLLVISSGCTGENAVLKPYIERSGDISEYEKTFLDNSSQTRKLPYSPGLVPEEREKLAQKERNLSGFANMSIRGYKFRVYADVGGPVYAEVNRSLDASSTLKVGDVVVFYTGIASLITETPNVEMLKVHWNDISLGRVEEVKKESVLVRYIKGGIFFEKISNNTFKAVPKPPGSIVWISKDKVLYVIENEN